MYPELPEAFFKPWIGYIDAVIILPDKIVVAEANVWDPYDALSKVDRYLPLVPKEPTFAAFMPRPIEGHIVVPYPTERVVVAARERGYIVDVFMPKWLEDHLRKRGLL